MQRKRRLGRPTRLTCESLEHRRLMAIDVGVVEGDLLIGGTADGAVSITSLEGGVLEVKEGDMVVATLNNVTDDIRVQLDPEGAVNDEVLLSLGNAPIDQVMVDLGGGDNVLSIDSGSLSGSLFLLGGEGSDSLLMGPEVEVEDNVFAWVGKGDNLVEVDGSIGRNLFVRAGEGNDSVALSDTAIVGRNADFKLGDGDNSASVSGQIEGRMSYRGGSGDDVAEIGETGVINGNASFDLGRGSNQVTHLGVMEGNLRVVSKNSEDTVIIDDTAIVGGQVIEQLGMETKRGGKGIGRFFFR